MSIRNDSRWAAPERQPAVTCLSVQLIELITQLETPSLHLGPKHRDNHCYYTLSTVIKGPLDPLYLKDQLFQEDEHINKAMRFVGFLISPKFKEIIWEIEDMNEFQEAYAFLEEKGYDMKFVIDAINSDLNLPPFKPQPIERYDSGVSGFLAAVMGSVPIEDVKTLFKNKLENNAEFKGLFEIVSSSEFKDILKRMSRNAKFSEFKNTFESYGVDFEFVCEILKEVYTDYDGIFCDQ
ncbi:unnamed protein product [Danaus chrysippus]|uniref:(African queen) hypothetical protein n=1 Tax=Danaus chrysippus TaxID=151541 RepID=A0A8J2QPL4_9NEOP|nr:unnamed protein product [Danaus chrysippus]